MKKVHVAYKTWKIDDVPMLEAERIRREAVTLSCDCRVDMRQVCRAFVHSSPTHWEVSINVTNTKRARAAGFKIYTDITGRRRK